MAITFGNSAPSQVTINLDAVFATSLANYKKKLIDQISLSNALFYELKKSGMWAQTDGGTDLREPLLYQLGQADSYSGYDELIDTPTDGITQAVYQWRQASVPITYSGLEKKQNKRNIIGLVDTKIMQAEEGFKAYLNSCLLQGSLATGGTDPRVARVSSFNGSQGPDTIWSFIDPTPTVSRSVGNIDQGTYTWWRNRVKSSAATTYLGLLLEMDNMYNTCARGPGGAPDIILVDQVTFELINAAYYAKFQTQAMADGNYPFDNIKFRKARIVWDEMVPDLVNNTSEVAAAGKGTMAFINSKFFKFKVEEDTDMELTDWQRPIRGDSKMAHILLMGQLTANHRRKLGVITNVARSLT